MWTVFGKPSRLPLRIMTAVRQVVASGGLAELVHAVDAADVLAGLETLGAHNSDLRNQMW